MSKDNKDIESQEQQAVPPHDVASTKTPISRWRCLKLFIKAHRYLVLISIAKRSTNAQGSLALTPPINCTDSEIGIITTPEVTFDVYSHVEGAAPDVVVSADNDDHDDVGDLQDLQFRNINKIMEKKDLASLCKFGGAPGFAEALGTDLEKGIPEDDQHCSCRQMASKSSNSQPPRRRFILLRLLSSPNNYTIFLLLLSALISIGLGIAEEGLRSGWREGVLILIAVVILLVFPLIRDSLNDLLPFSEKQKALSEEKEMEVDVVRGGTEKKIFVSNILLGDVVCLKRGCQVPADGLFVSDDSLQLDDGSNELVNAANPFLFYGAEVINGEGRMIVTSVGENKVWAEMFEVQLDKINTWKQIVGLIISIFIIVVLFLRFKFTKQEVESGIPDIKGKPLTVNEFKDVINRILRKPNGKISTLITSLIMLLVGVVEGLPFCISLAIAYWRRAGLTFAQQLSACVAMGSVTAICTDKIGGLTVEPLEVDKFYIGKDEITQESVIHSSVEEAIRDGISTTLLLPQASRSAIDEPLLSWAVFRLPLKLEGLRPPCPTILQRRELIEEEERELLITDTMCLHSTGLAKKILPKCSHYLNNEGVRKSIDEQERLVFQKIVEKLKSTCQKVIALAYKPKDEETDFILLGLVSLKLSIRTDIKDSIEACRTAKVRIILVSGDDVETLMAIAQQFGILQENLNGQEVITGQDFRNLTEEESMKMVNEIKVMGNSLPSDKRLLVKLLRENGHSVAVIGTSTHDVPMLKAADVGLAMGSWSTNVTRASADIILWDTNISILFPVLRYGRCIYNNIQKYIQLELTMLVSGLLIASITIVCTGDMPITTIQSSWVNMVVPLLGGLALLTEPPSEKLMEMPSERNEAVITKTMWKNIISQAIFQATILVTFLFKGQAILDINQKVSKTMIFNSFVLCQLFNQFNLRELELKNKFKAIPKYHCFWVALGVTVALQEVFIEIAHLIASTSRLNWAQWGFCFLIGMVPMAIDWAEKFILGFFYA